MKISIQLDRLIKEQDDEIATIQTQATANLAAARDRLALLKRARAKVTPDVDDLAESLRAAGIWPKS